MRKQYINLKPSEIGICHIELLRRRVDELHTMLEETVPMTRERSMALTKLEEFLMWGVKAIVFQFPHDAPEGELVEAIGGVAVINGILRLREVEVGKGRPGPYALVVNRQIEAVLNDPYWVIDPKGPTIRQRILSLEGIRRIDIDSHPKSVPMYLTQLEKGK